MLLLVRKVLSDEWLCKRTKWRREIHDSGVFSLLIAAVLHNMAAGAGLTVRQWAHILKRPVNPLTLCPASGRWRQWAETLSIICHSNQSARGILSRRVTAPPIGWMWRCIEVAQYPDMVYKALSRPRSLPFPENTVCVCERSLPGSPLFAFCSHE